jgi:hypothetical protein
MGIRHLIVTDSDIIESIGFVLHPHNLVEGALEVVFKSSPDMIYKYNDVRLTTFAELISAESIGKDFHEKFKRTKHPFVKSAKLPTLKK